ncbi:Uncharacterised protein [uncultured archaeon]|nr:Uncharacterised protein [uncultured archaeon]
MGYFDSNDSYLYNSVESKNSRHIPMFLETNLFFFASAKTWNLDRFFFYPIFTELREIDTLIFLIVFLLELGKTMALWGSFDMSVDQVQENGISAEVVDLEQ